jgi:hypothetical protein
MKKYFLSFALALTTILSYGQDISDVEQRSSGTIITLKSNGSEISRMSLSSGESLSGFSNYIVVVTRSSGTVICYDQNFREISRMSLSSGEFVKNVSGNNIIVKRPSGTVITYDKNFREISRRSE